MGNSLKELGRLDEARAAFAEAVRRDPKITGTYVNLADSMTFASGDPYLAEMESLGALRLFDRIEAVFAPQLFHDMAGLGDMSPRSRLLVVPISPGRLVIC